MNLTSFASAGNPALTPPAPAMRLDDQRRDIVDHGVALQQLSGTVSAVEYLRSQGIAPNVIARVLGEPDRRRQPAP